MEQSPNYIAFGRKTQLPQALQINLLNCDLQPLETVKSGNASTN